MEAGAVISMRTRAAEPARRLDPTALGDHLDRLYGAAYALCGSREDAEDLVQDTYAGVLARPRFLRRETDLAYLLGALRKTFLVKLRSERRRPRTWAAGDELERLRRARTDDDRQEAHELLRLIASLPAEFRDAIVAVDLLGLSYRDAARALHVREGTVRSRLFRGRQAVATKLG